MTSAVLAVVVALVGLGPTTAGAETSYVYDVTTVARVDVRASGGADSGSTQFTGLREWSALPSTQARGASTTPYARVVATYNEAGQQLTTSTPQGPVGVGDGDPTFDVTSTNYNGFGQADTLGVLIAPDPAHPDDLVPDLNDLYVKATTFDDLGRVTQRTLGRTTATNIATLERAYGYDTATGAVNSFQAGWKVNGTTTWFQNDSYTRDAIGNVTQIVDNGKEPTGAASAVKECFLYDQWNRLVRAHTAATAGTCATTTSSATVATGTLDAYDQVYTFDDVNRMTTRVDKLAVSNATTTYAYANSAHPQAVTATTGGTTGTFAYNAAGAMTTRNGATLTYDPMQRLTAYASTETYLLSTSNQRLVRQAGPTRTLYLPGMEVAVTGAVRTITKYVTIGSTQVATRTTVGTSTPTVAWNCGSMQNSTICQAPAPTTTGAQPIPARKRYLPYGAPRNAVTFTNTDHGYLNQPTDTTGLTYLNNRYYDPQLGVFASVDPLVAKTGVPYLYASGNPETLSDPTGQSPADACADLGAAGACHRVLTDWVTNNSAQYTGEVGADGSDLRTVAETLNIEAAGAVPGELWGQLADLGWTYFQKLNFFYWMHRLVQADFVAKVPGAKMEFDCGSGEGSRADVCRNDEYIEIKPIGGDDQGYRQLQKFLVDLYKNTGREGWPASGPDWPSEGQIGVPGTPLSVTYARSAVFAGVWTWSYSGGPLPTWADWKAQQRDQVRAYEASLTTAAANSFNWRPLSWLAFAASAVALGAKLLAACVGDDPILASCSA